jgi:hypothetical protein
MRGKRWIGQANVHLCFVFWKVGVLVMSIDSMLLFSRFCLNFCLQPYEPPLA